MVVERRGRRRRRGSDDIVGPTSATEGGRGGNGGDDQSRWSNAISRRANIGTTPTKTVTNNGAWGM